MTNLQVVLICEHSSKVLKALDIKFRCTIKLSYCESHGFELSRIIFKNMELANDSIKSTKILLWSTYLAVAD